MQEVFISWSGEKANKYAEFLKKLFEKVFGKSANIFYSGNIESGSVWLEKINYALLKSKVGIIVLTRESVERPWVNFEAGAIFKANSKASVIPICVDFNFDELEKHPLRFFQSRYYFDWKSMLKLFQYLKEKFQWEYQVIALEDVKKEFDIFVKENSDVNSIENLLFKNKISIYEYGCFMAEIPEEKFWMIRREIIGISKGSIVLAGQSLEDAFGERGIVSIVDKLKKCIESGQIDRKSVV